MTALPLADALGVQGPLAVVRAMHIAFSAFHLVAVATALGMAIVIAVRLCEHSRSSIPALVLSRMIRFYPIVLVLAAVASALPSLLGMALADNIELTVAIRTGGWFLLGPAASAAALASAAFLLCCERSTHRRLIFIGIAIILLIGAGALVRHNMLAERIDLWLDVPHYASDRSMAVWLVFIVHLAQVLSLALASAGIALVWFARAGVMHDDMIKLGLRIAAFNAASFAVAWIAAFAFIGPAPDMLLRNLPLAWHIVTVFAAGALAGSAVIGIVRPHNPVWIIAATGSLLFTALCMQAARIQTAARLALDHAQLLPPPVRTQPVMMAIVLAGIAALIGGGVYVIATRDRWLAARISNTP